MEIEIQSVEEATFLTDEIKDMFWSRNGNVDKAPQLDNEA